MTADEIDSLWIDILKYADPTAGNAHIRFAHALLSQPEQLDTKRLDWLSMHGSFGVDSSSGYPGGNGQKCMAATRKNIDAGMAQTESKK